MPTGGKDLQLSSMPTGGREPSINSLRPSRSNWSLLALWPTALLFIHRTSLTFGYLARSKRKRWVKSLPFRENNRTWPAAFKPISAIAVELLFVRPGRSFGQLCDRHASIGSTNPTLAFAILTIRAWKSEQPLGKADVPHDEKSETDAQHKLTRRTSDRKSRGGSLMQRCP